MKDARIRIEGAGGTRIVALTDYLDPARDEQAAEDALAWIKRLRHVEVDGAPLRRRFTYRGDSLWWFAELYLHKQQVVLDIFRTVAAIEALVEREQPQSIRIEQGSRVLRGIAPQVAAARGVRVSGPHGFGSVRGRLAAMEARAAWLHYSALASRLRGSRPPEDPPPAVAAFIHRAFWRADTSDGSAESYIGPVLEALERRAGPAAVKYVSVGPSSNFRARRWWHPLAGTRAGAATPVEAYAPLARLAGSRALWRDRYTLRRALWTSADIRRHAVIHGCDCWPLIREELAGVAILQWPWSARTMDEAGAALDALTPAALVTYAEAGGWGRALVLEARRRGIPSIGLQHGFIYRHWLNYRHEPDEMAADAAHAADRGFPFPTRTLLFDEYAAHHLEAAGRFPRAALEVTGSPRLDALVARTRALTPADLDRARAEAGAAEGDALLVVATKYREARGVIGPLLDAAAQVGGVHVAIKTHPAETPDTYGAVAGGRPHVTVLPASAPLAPLLAAARAVATVNSTVALDAAVLDVPALVIGLPNNLSPFVDAGLLVGAPPGPPAGALAQVLAGALAQILYDEEFRHQLGRVRREVLSRYQIQSNGEAAVRSAAAILRLALADGAIARGRVR